jgi:hypothetical protein
VGGPTEQSTNTVFIPPGEGRQTFSPQPLAWIVENFEIGPDDILQSIVGPTILRIKAEAYKTGSSVDNIELEIDDGLTGQWPSTVTRYGYKTGEPFSIFSAPLLNGSAQMLLYRVGPRLFSFNGGMDDPDEVLIDGLSVSPDSRFLDQYVVVNDKIIYFNGIDQPQVITYEGQVTPLGFDRKAAALAVSSPSQPDFDDVPNYYPNAMGYSWQGRIGTPGDELTGQKASLLKGAWYYYTQYEDIHGNLSEFSPPSDPATIHTNQADPYFVPAVQNTDSASGILGIISKTKPITKRTMPTGVEIDDLTRRFLLKSSGDLPKHSVATRIFRTADTNHKDQTPKFVARVPGSRQFYFDDNNADSDLGMAWTPTVSVPVFRVACSHQGRLVIGNIPGAPGMVRQSQPGFPGTFESDDYIFPDSQGAEITALASSNGSLIAFTANSTYLIGDDFSTPQPLATGVGCVSQKSIQSMRDGSLIWLAADGFYSLGLNGQLKKISLPIQKIFERELNESQFYRAVSVIDHDTGEYRCAVSEKGRKRNTMILCFDGQHWRRQTLGIDIADMCSVRDHTHLTLAIGSDPREQGLASFGKTTEGQSFRGYLSLSRVFVLNHQTTDYFGPPRRIRYRSAWLRSSDYGLVPTNVRSLYVGLLDAWVGVATVRLYRNGSWKPIAEMNDLLLHGPDDESELIDDVAGEAVVGASSTRNSRVFWRQIPVDIQNANSWAFEIELLGSPSPRFKVDDSAKSAETAEKLEERSWESLFANPEYGVLAFQDKKNIPAKWELGRLKIAAFAFDVSIATKGSPLGRVPFRKDK